MSADTPKLKGLPEDRSHPSRPVEVSSSSGAGSLTTPQLYRVKDWDLHHENNRSRDLKRLDWVPLPQRLGSDAYAAIMEQQNGAELFGTMIALVLVASASNPRGELRKESGKAHDSKSLSRITRIPESTIQAALAVGCSEDVGWFEIAPDVALACGNPAPSCDISAPTCGKTATEGEGEGEEKENGNRIRKKKGAAKASPPAQSDEDFLQSLQKQTAYAHLNVAVEFNKMENWCRQHRRQPTRKRFVNWLNNAEQPPLALQRPTQATDEAF